jgi:hypothetical protein
MEDEAASNDGNVYIDTDESRSEDDDGGGLKSALLRLLAKVTPNESTPDELTQDILRAASALEAGCPTSEVDVLPRLAGKWLWLLNVCLPSLYYLLVPSFLTKYDMIFFSLH